MRTIAVVTVARSDFGCYLPLLRAIRSSPGLRLHLIVSGTHLSPEFGLTVQSIEEEGFTVGERVEMLLSSDTPEGIVKSMGLGLIGFSQLFGRSRPDILVVLGDRFEMHAAALAALPFKIPVAHLHGGELTEGAIDDSLRHSITKLSHLHFVATEEYARRVIRMGEEPWRVTVSGAPSLDNLSSFTPMTADELESAFGLIVTDAPLLVTFHPVTLEYEQAGAQVAELLSALDELAMPVVFTMPNADTCGRVIADMIGRFVESHASATVVPNFGTRGYFTMMTLAAAMVGNSSSGIVEAASFKLPVVNIGTRQAGRLRPGNVIDVGCARGEIVQAGRRATAPELKASLADLVNPYGSGEASRIIVERLETVLLNQRLLAKRFFDGNLDAAGG